MVVHRTRKDAVSLSVHMEDTARVILNKVSQHFKLDPSRHELCELDSAGGENGWGRGNGCGFIYLLHHVSSEGCGKASDVFRAHKDVRQWPPVCFTTGYCP